MSDLRIRGGRLLDPGSSLDEVGDLLIRGDRIAAVGLVHATGAEEVIEAAGLLVTPGLIDLHVHLREPGQEQKETIATGTRAAAAGGFTTVVCEPNTAPPRDTPERIAEVIGISARRAAVQVLPKCCITSGQKGLQVADLAGMHAAGAVAASDDGFSVVDREVMREAMIAARAAGIPLTVHVDGPAMVERDIGLAAELDCAVHFSHLSLTEECELIAKAQARGLRVTGEATPHHLTLSADDVPADAPNFKMNPPLRSAKDRAAVQLATAMGVITVIASDHAPHSLAEKAVSYGQAPSGVIGLETTLGVIWTVLVHTGVMQASAVVRAMTLGPARVLRMDAPALRAGARAEVTLIDPQAEWTVDPERFESKSRNCPFAGARLRGKAVGTIANGRAVMREGRILVPGAVS